MGAPGNDDVLTSGAFALAGFGTRGLRERLVLPDDVAVFYAGLLARQPRTASGLEQILAEYFGWPVVVEQYNGQWLYLDDENKAIMPAAGRPGRNVSLGRDVVIGRRVWDVQGNVRIVVGPIDGESFRRLLPGGDARPAFVAMVRLYLGLELDVEVRLVLAPDEVPWCNLEYDEDRGPRLGRNGWVRTHNFGRPVSDAAFTAD
jgi:type VI secretion system protein ImpH